MPEALTVAAGVTTVVSNVWKISKEVYELIDGIKNAPDHIKAVSQDVRGLYVVLGALQELLVKIQEGQLPPAAMPVFELLDEPMRNCFTAFVELQQKINKYTKRTGDINKSIWKCSWWFFTEKDTNAWRVHLAAYKSTVTIALGAANLGNTTSNIHATQNLEIQIHEMRIQLERLELNGLENQRQSIVVENGSPAADNQFALHRFLETAESVFSGSPSASPPIPQIRSSSILLPPPPLPPRYPQLANRPAQGRCTIYSQKVPQVWTQHFLLNQFLETAETNFSGSPPLSTTFTPNRERCVSPPPTPLLSPKSPNSRNAALRFSLFKKKKPRLYGPRNKSMIGLTPPKPAESSRSKASGLSLDVLTAVAGFGAVLGLKRRRRHSYDRTYGGWSHSSSLSSDDEGPRRCRTRNEYEYYSDSSSEHYREPPRSRRRFRVGSIF